MFKLSKYLFFWPVLLSSSLQATPVTSNVAEKVITTQQASKQTQVIQTLPLRNVIALLQKEVVDQYILQVLTQYMEANAMNCARYLEQLNLVKLIQQYLVSNKATITLLESNITLLELVLHEQHATGQCAYWQELKADMTHLLQQKVQFTQVLEQWAPKFKQKGLLQLKGNADGLQQQINKLKPLSVQQLKTIISAAEAKLQELVGP